MRFTIRDGFVIHLVTLVDQGDDRAPVRQETTHYAKTAVELDAIQAKDHAHKLEPFKDSKGKVDADSAAFLDGLVVNSPAPPSNADIDRLVAEKVAQALAAVLGPAAVAAAASTVPAPGTGAAGA